MQYVDVLSQLLNGASIQDARVDGDLVIAHLTVSQASKLQAMDITVEFRNFAGNRVTVALDKNEVDSAYEDNKRAPRASSSVAVDIASRTVYRMRVSEDCPNEFGRIYLDKSVFDDEDLTGVIEINDVQYTIGLGEAKDFYEISEDADPTRRVYFVEISISGQNHVISSYGLTNLLRSLAKLDYIG